MRFHILATLGVACLFLGLMWAFAFSPPAMLIIVGLGLLVASVGYKQRP